jgi:EamA domain-containing membrane protein RarD
MGCLVLGLFLNGLVGYAGFIVFLVSMVLRGETIRTDTLVTFVVWGLILFCLYQLSNKYRD